MEGQERRQPILRWYDHSIQRFRYAEWSRYRLKMFRTPISIGALFKVGTIRLQGTVFTFVSISADNRSGFLQAQMPMAAAKE